MSDSKITLVEAIKGLEELRDKIKNLKDGDELKVAGFNTVRNTLFEVETRLSTIEAGTTDFDDVDSMNINSFISTIKDEIQNINGIMGQKRLMKPDSHRDTGYMPGASSAPGIYL